MKEGMENPIQEKSVDDMTLDEINAELSKKGMVHPDDKFWNDVSEGKLKIFLKGVRAGRITPESLREEDVSFWAGINEASVDKAETGKDRGFWKSE